MKSKKKQNSNIVLSLTDTEHSAVIQALDFLMHCENFSYTDAKITYDTVMIASEKLDSGEFCLTRGQFRACIIAVKESVSRLSGGPEEYTDVATTFPDLIPDIKESLPVLVQLLPHLRAKLS